MIWLVLLLLAVVLVGLSVWKHSEAPRPPVDPEEAVKAAIELHQIRRRLDVAWTKTEQRQDAARLRREIGGALDDGAGR